MKKLNDRCPLINPRAALRAACAMALAMSFVGAGGSAGCARTFPPVQSRFELAEAEFEIPPKQLLQSARQMVTDPPLALGVEREGKGWFITGYQRFPGEWHIGRRWQERTQYRVAVIPDFDKPTSRARLQITEQTQQRAANGQEWKPANELNRPERARALVRELEKRLRDPGAATAPS